MERKKKIENRHCHCEENLFGFFSLLYTLLQFCRFHIHFLLSKYVSWSELHGRLPLVANSKELFCEMRTQQKQKNIQNNKLETYDCTYIVFVIAVFCVANGVAIALVIIFAASQTDYEHMYMMIDCYQPYEVHNHLTPPHRKKKYYMNKRYWRGQ